MPGALIGPDLIDAAMPVISALDEMRVPYYVAGSVASSLHGIPRSTLDCDLVAALTLAHAAPLAAALSDGYYADVDVIRGAIRARRMFNVVHLPTMMKVDVYPVADRFSAATMQRRLHAVLDGGGATAALAPPEDVVLHKLLWYRDGGCVSERQWGDVLGLFQVKGPSLDRAYMDEWATELGIADLLARARKEAGHE